MGIIRCSGSFTFTTSKKCHVSMIITHKAITICDIIVLPDTILVNCSDNNFVLPNKNIVSLLKVLQHDITTLNVA